MPCSSVFTLFSLSLLPQDILERRKRIAKLTEQHKPQLDEFDAKSKAQKAKLSAAVPVLPSTQAQPAAAAATEDESDGGVPGLEADDRLSDSRPQSPSAKGSSTPHNLIDQQVETDESARLATQEPLKVLLSQTLDCVSSRS